MSSQNGKCDSCGRPLPKEPSDAPVDRRTRFSVSEPRGEEGSVEDLLIQIVDKYTPLWPDEFAAVGERMWKYRALHFALYQVLISDLKPEAVGG